MRGKVVITAILILLAGISSAQKPSSLVTNEANQALQQIDAERIRAHVKFLASDLLEGRGTGQRGGDIAAQYLATQFALNGLQPAGDTGTYMQKVPMVGVTPDSAMKFSFVTSGKSTDLKVLDQYVAYDQTQQPKSDVDADIVFVGYGIEAPEYKWDDYKDTDVKGKVLLMLVNEPLSSDVNFFKGKALTYYGRWTYKYEEAARKGAVGAILIHETTMASYPWDVVRNSNSGEKSYLKLDGTPKLKVASWIQLKVAKDLLASSGVDFNKLFNDAQSTNFHPVTLPSRLKAHMVSKLRPFESNNVLAMVPGSDAKLKEEAVLYSAHYDHLGIRPDMPGDNIYNGANDNATGCGILLELARAFSQAPQKPKRSIVFAAVTAEEQLLLGSEYLGKHPPLPAGKITLNLNFDDIPPLGTPEEVEVSGSERTTFSPTVLAIANEFQLTVRPDSFPQAGHYYRSDHFSMARVGVPSFSVSAGMKYKGHDAAWGARQADEYTATRYHQPSDEYRDDMDFSSDAVMARFGLALGWEAADQPDLIGWQKGDEFEPARLNSLAGSH
ncbi:MAG TPA: M28 family peptidase [Terriglobales bacterium]